MKLFSPQVPLSALQTHLIAGATFVFLAIIATYPLSLHLGNGVVSPSDPLLASWDIAWIAHQLTDAPLQLFDANIFHPLSRTLAFDDLFLGETFLVYPILVATGNPILAHNLATLLSFALCGFTMYLLAFDWTGRAFPSFAAGIIFAFFPYRFAHLAHVNLLTLQWVPLMTLYLTRLVVKPKWKTALLFVIFSVLQLTSSLTNAYIIALLLAVYATVLMIAKSRALQLKTFGLLALSGLIILVLMLPFAAPYIENSRAYGLFRNQQEIEALGATVSSYLAISPENWLYGNLLARFAHQGNYPHEHVLFPGFIVLGLAAAAIFFPSKRGIRLALAWMCLCAFVLSFGPRLYLSAGQLVSLPFALPYAWLYGVLPGFQGIRAGVRFAAILQFSLACASAFGIIALEKWTSPRIRPLLGVALVALLLLEYASFPVPIYAVPTGDSVPPVYRWLASQPTSPVAEYPIGQGLTMVNRQMLYTYYSAYHWQPLPAPGFTSYQPPYFGSLLGILNTFPADAALDALAEFQTKYVIIHTEKLKPKDWISMQSSLKKSGLRTVRNFDGDVVVELAPRQVDLGALGAHAYLASGENSDGTTRVYLVLSNPTKQSFFFNPTKQIRLANGGQSIVFDMPFILEPGSTILETTQPCCAVPEDWHTADDSILPVTMGWLPSSAPGAPTARPIPLVLLKHEINIDSMESSLTLDLTWQVQGRVREHFISRAAGIDQNGVEIAAGTAEMMPDTNPNIRWRPGQTLTQRIGFSLKDPSNITRIQIRLFDPETATELFPLDSQGKTISALELDLVHPHE